MKRRRRQPERGNALILAMIVLTALGSLSALTVVSVQGDLSTTSNDHFHAIAVYAAESGGAVAMDWLRTQSSWTPLISANNATIQAPASITGNNVAVGGTGNPFSTDQQAWYKVEIYNNKNDPGYATGQDIDKRIILHVTGHGPNGSTAVLEWEVAAGPGGSNGTPCNAYAQRNNSEEGGGAADCVGTIQSGTTATMRPGG